MDPIHEVKIKEISVIDKDMYFVKTDKTHFYLSKQDVLFILGHLNSQFTIFAVFRTKMDESIHNSIYVDGATQKDRVIIKSPIGDTFTSYSKKDLRSCFLTVLLG